MRCGGSDMQNARMRARRLNLALYYIDHVYYANEQKNSIKDSELCLMYALDDGSAHSQKQICQDWLIPKTTLNTIIKQWEQSGYLRLSAIPGKRRELTVQLTDAGKAYAKPFLDVVYRAEDEALRQTIERYSERFIEAMEYYGAALRDSFEREATAAERCQSAAARRAKAAQSPGNHQPL